MKHSETFEPTQTYTHTHSNVAKPACALEQAQAKAYLTRAGNAHLHL